MNNGPQGYVTNPLIGNLNYTASTTFFQGFFGKLVGILFVVGSIIFLFMLIIGAIRWISSGGDKGAVEGAKGQITNALIGIVVLFGVFAIVSFVSTFFGVNLLAPVLTPITP